MIAKFRISMYRMFESECTEFVGEFTTQLFYIASQFIIHSNITMQQSQFLTLFENLSKEKFIPIIYAYSGNLKNYFSLGLNTTSLLFKEFH